MAGRSDFSSFAAEHDHVTKLIIIPILVIAIAIGLSITEGILLDFYQETPADHWATLGSIPVLIYLSFIFVRKRWRTSPEKGGNKILDSIIYTWSVVISVCAIYYFLIMPAISGTIVLVNAYIGQQKVEKITGIVTEITAVSMQRSAKYELRIETNSGELILETNGIVVQQYEVGEAFKEELMRGSLGLFVKHKTTR